MYGLSAGMIIAWSVALVGAASMTHSGWDLIGAATALAAGLIINRRAVARSKGRRWRQTRQ